MLHCLYVYAIPTSNNLLIKLFLLHSVLFSYLIFYYILIYPYRIAHTRAVSAVGFASSFTPIQPVSGLPHRDRWTEVRVVFARILIDFPVDDETCHATDPLPARNDGRLSSAFMRAHHAHFCMRTAGVWAGVCSALFAKIAIPTVSRLSIGVGYAQTCLP